MLLEFLFLLPLFFAIAFIYSSVGHGGATGYLAIFLIFTALSRDVFVPIVLILNIVVSSIGFVNYQKAGHFNFKMLIPFIITSIPFAFIGGMMEMPKDTLNILIGIVLLFSGIYLLFFKQQIRNGGDEKKLYLIAPFLGIGVGFLSGIIGIGGGIFLSPILLFFRMDIKKVSAVVSAFIVLNSLSGLSAYLMRGSVDVLLLIPILLTVAIAGFIGSKQGALKFSSIKLQKFLGVVLIIASFKMIYEFSITYLLQIAITVHALPN